VALAGLESGVWERVLLAIRGGTPAMFRAFPHAAPPGSFRYSAYVPIWINRTRSISGLSSTSEADMDYSPGLHRSGNGDSVDL
jgi:hypothetical protein